MQPSCLAESIWQESLHQAHKGVYHRSFSLRLGTVKTLARIVLIVLGSMLLASVLAMQVDYGHETLYRIHYPWLREVREVSIFSVRRDPALVRLGLVALILAFAVMNLPLNEVHSAVTLPHWH
jgi:hypothetical protein